MTATIMDYPVVYMTPRALLPDRLVAEVGAPESPGSVVDLF